MDPTPPPPEGRPLGELFRSLSADAARLVRQEVALARRELADNLRAAVTHAALAAAGATVAALGALLLLQALVLGLGVWMGRRYWLASLAVGVVLLVAGGLLVGLGGKGARVSAVAPKRTLAELRRTRAWARDEAHGFRAALAGPPAEAPARVSAAEPVPTDPEAPAPPPREPLWKRVVRELNDDDLTNQAAKVAFYFFLSLPPLAMALFATTGVLGGNATADWIAARLQAMLPREAGALVGGFVDDVVRQEHPGPLSLGLLLALWAGSNVFTAMEDTLNSVYGIAERRGFVARRLVALATMAAVGVLFIAGTAALLAGPAISRAVGLGAAGDRLWSVAQWPLAFALVVGAFWVIYYVLPLRDQRGCKRVLLKSSAVAAALWLLATVAFRLYIANFGSYSATYGVLGTVIVLLLWMYVTSLVILLGGEISSEMEKGRA